MKILMHTSIPNLMPTCLLATSLFYTTVPWISDQIPMKWSVKSPLSLRVCHIHKSTFVAGA